jgi:hypothetical protein
MSYNNETYNKYNTILGPIPGLIPPTVAKSGKVTIPNDVAYRRPKNLLVKPTQLIHTNNNNNSTEENSSKLINKHKLSIENMIETSKVKHAHTSNINSFNSFPIAEKVKESAVHVTIDNNTAALVHVLERIEKTLNRIDSKLDIISDRLM